MKKFILLLVFIFSIGFIKGQTTFFKTIGNYNVNATGNYVEQTTDGGYFIAGTFYSIPLPGYAGYAVKTNSIGDTLWTKLYGNSATFNSAKQTNDGGYIIAGSIKNGSYDDVYVVKIDSLGTIQWQKNIGGSNNDAGTSIKQTSDGGYIVLGYTKSLGAGNFDVCVIKLSASGSIQWQNILGSTDFEKAYSIEETNDGGFIISGVISDYPNGTNYLIKLNNLGILQWSKGYSESAINNRGQSILQTADNGYLILGNRIDTSAAFSEMMTIIKTDSVGNINWSKTYTGLFYNDVVSIKKTSGECIISGRLTITYSMGLPYTKMLYTSIDTVGNILWSNAVGLGSFSNSGAYANYTTDGGYIYTGFTSSPSVGGYMYFVKADSLGRSGCNDSLVSLTATSVSLITSTPTTLSATGLSISTPSALPRYGLDSIKTYCTTVGINELSNTPQISVYPNPSSGQFNFSDLEKGSKIEVFDITGRIIYQLIANNNFETINISDKAKGIYFYRITKEIKLVQSGKIALQ